MYSLDFLGMFFSLLGTYLFAKANIRMWLTYIIATNLNIVLYFQSKMYGAIFLEITFLLLSIYGWIFWSQQQNHHSSAISQITSREALLLSIILMFFVYLSYILLQLTDSTFPLLEAIGIGLSLIAQWLSCRKILQCWVVWILADSIYIFTMSSKELYFHAILFSSYLGIAIGGFIHWRNLFLKQNFSY